MAEPPQKKRGPNFTDEELHALIAAVILTAAITAAIIQNLAGK